MTCATGVMGKTTTSGMWEVGMLLDRRCCVTFFLTAPGCSLGDGGAVFFFFSYQII